MGCGLFGKLPAKRDFVSDGAPRAFLDPFERWLQGSIASSRQTMGEAWQPAYLKMPIWRFWLGEGHAGATTAGAFMPSVDGIGRYFPLAVFAVAEPGEAFPPPDLDPFESWFSRLEAILLDALEPSASYERLKAGVAGLGPPPAGGRTPHPGLVRISGDAVMLQGEGVGIGNAIAAARIAMHRGHNRHLACLWTVGGEDFPPAAIVGTALPDPTRFPILMTGEGGVAGAAQRPGEAS